MLGFETLDDLQREYCKTIISSLPRFVDPEQPPKKKLPFSTIHRHPFIHNVQLLLPQDLFDAVWSSRLRDTSTSQYVNVKMSLSDLLEADFFSRYVKTGDELIETMQALDLIEEPF
ncbi:hypothetical protein KEM54_001039 [Ascosphaera aggregata]|nr:hypothetical protein KEM54_001039 [Ascosphaera aggregata]